MSNIALSGNASGTGTFTIASPNSNSDRTINLPDQNGTVFLNSVNGALNVNAAAPANTLVADASGNVGIGTSSPVTKLFVYDSSRTSTTPFANIITSFRSNGTNADSTIQFSDNVANAVQLGLVGGSNGALGFATAGNERARIDSSGNLLVGTTSGGNQRIGAYRNVSSTTRLSNIMYWGGVNGNGADIHLQFTDSIAHNYYFGGNNGGAYVIATSNGVRLASGGTAWSSDSDERLKTDLASITDATNKVQQLRAVTGRYKTDDEGVSRSFLIAQDVQAVLPEAVDASDPEALGLRYTEVIPLLVAAIKELKAEVDALKAQLASDGPSNGAQA